MGWLIHFEPPCIKNAFQYPLFGLRSTSTTPFPAIVYRNKFTNKQHGDLENCQVLPD